MKKTIIMAFVFAAVAGLVLTGSVFAQSGTPPLDGQKGPRDGSGLLHEYMAEAMADALGVTVEELQASHDAGEKLYDLALAQGFAAEDIPALMRGAHDAAVEAALADGVITQEQVDLMQSRGGKRGERRNNDARGQFEGGRGNRGSRGGFGQQPAQ